MNIGVEIKKRRKEKGLTQKQLAEEIGVSTITIQNYENNRRTPNIDMINKIELVLGSFFISFDKLEQLSKKLNTTVEELAFDELKKFIDDDSKFSLIMNLEEVGALNKTNAKLGEIKSLLEKIKLLKVNFNEYVNINKNQHTTEILNLFLIISDVYTEIIKNYNDVVNNNFYIINNLKFQLNEIEKIITNSKNIK